MSSVQDILGLGNRGAVGVGGAGGSKPPAAMDLRSIRVDAIEPDPEQPRRTIDERTIDELAESIRRDGLLQPIRVRQDLTRPGRYVVIAGERRWRATQRAGLAEIPAIVVSQRGRDDRVRVEQVVENLHREEINAVEEGQCYRTLLDVWGCSQAELARRLSKSAAHVCRVLAVLELDDETKLRIVRGEVSYADAIAAHAKRQEQEANAGRSRTRRRRAAPTDKRRGVTVETRAAGVVRVKRGYTLEQLVEELRGMIDQERGTAAA
jgi:ParB family chromosome partitioning protein